MRDWLLRPEHIVASVVLVPMLSMVLLYACFSIRDHKRRRPPKKALRWLLAVGAGVVLYWGWLMTIPPLRLLAYILVLTVVVTGWVVMLDMVVTRRGTSRVVDEKEASTSGHAVRRKS